MLAPSAAFAASSSSVSACQLQQQETLLAPFNALPGSAAGQAVLAANLQTINSIYLNSTQAQKIASGTHADNIQVVGEVCLGLRELLIVAGRQDSIGCPGTRATEDWPECPAGSGSSGGVLAEHIGGATLGSAETTLAVSAQRGFALNERVGITVAARLGWSHEFAGNAASVTANFQNLSDSGFALGSASIGRNAALVGLDADIGIAPWRMAFFIGYGGAISGGSNAQSFSAGLRFAW